MQDKLDCDPDSQYTGYVYIIVSHLEPTIYYVGSTIKKIEERFQDHVKGGRNMKLSQYIIKHGSNVKIYHVEKVHFKKEAELRHVEDLWIWRLEPLLNQRMTIINGISHYSNRQKKDFVKSLLSKEMDYSYDDHLRFVRVWKKDEEKVARRKLEKRTTMLTNIDRAISGNTDTSISPDVVKFIKKTLDILDIKDYHLTGPLLIDNTKSHAYLKYIHDMPFNERTALYEKMKKTVAHIRVKADLQINGFKTCFAYLRGIYRCYLYLDVDVSVVREWKRRGVRCYEFQVQIKPMNHI